MKPNWRIRFHFKLFFTLPRFIFCNQIVFVIDRFLLLDWKDEKNSIKQEKSNQDSRYLELLSSTSGESEIRKLKQKPTSQQLSTKTLRISSKKFFFWKSVRHLSTYLKSILLCWTIAYVQRTADKVVLNINNQESVHRPNNLKLTRTGEGISFFSKLIELK